MMTNPEVYWSHDLTFADLVKPVYSWWKGSSHTRHTSCSKTSTSTTYLSNDIATITYRTAQRWKSKAKMNDIWMKSLLIKMLKQNVITFTWCTCIMMLKDNNFKIWHTGWWEIWRYILTSRWTMGWDASHFYFITNMGLGDVILMDLLLASRWISSTPLFTYLFTRFCCSPHCAYQWNIAQDALAYNGFRRGVTFILHIMPEIGIGGVLECGGGT